MSARVLGGTKHLVRSHAQSPPHRLTTGAGKTYTMTGTKNQYRLRGIIPRAIHHIFMAVKSTEDTAMVRVSYLEIYNETIYDLLDLTTQPQEIALVEDSRGRVHPRGVSNQVVSTEGEALSFMFKASTAERLDSFRPRYQYKNVPKKHIVYCMKSFKTWTMLM